MPCPALVLQLASAQPEKVMAENQDIPILRGTAPRFRFRLTTPEPVTGWTTLLVIRPTLTANAVVSKAGAIANATDVPNAEQTGVFDVTLSAAETTSLTGRTYHYSFRRTDAGFEDVLAYGTLNVESAA
jgi:hypothetical protein